MMIHRVQTEQQQRLVVPNNVGWARDESHQNQQEKLKESKRRQNFVSNHLVTLGEALNK
jgi:hypothetical protein